MDVLHLEINSACNTVWTGCHKELYCEDVVHATTTESKVTCEECLKFIAEVAAMVFCTHADCIAVMMPEEAEKWAQGWCPDHQPP